MSKYPTLTKMGITSVENIDKYTVQHQGEVDVLKIYYKRPKGSLLSRSKKFSFMRGRNYLPIEARNSKAFDQMESINPELMHAIDELKQLNATREKDSQMDPKKRMMNDLDHLEKVMTSKIDDLRRQIEEMK